MGATEKRGKLRYDIMLAAALLLVAAGAFLIFTLTARTGASVTVTQNGTQIASYPLGEDRTVTLTDDSGGENVLVIKGGEAYVESANCRDGICADHRPVKYEGESIVCLPHGLVITVVGAADSGVDTET